MKNPGSPLWGWPGQDVETETELRRNRYPALAAVAIPKYAIVEVRR
jgi:hypothetical protein